MRDIFYEADYWDPRIAIMNDRSLTIYFQFFSWWVWTVVGRWFHSFNACIILRCHSVFYVFQDLSLNLGGGEGLWNLGSGSESSLQSLTIPQSETRKLRKACFLTLPSGLSNVSSFYLLRDEYLARCCICKTSGWIHRRVEEFWHKQLTQSMDYVEWPDLSTHTGLARMNHETSKSI